MATTDYLLPVDFGTIERRRGDTKPFCINITDPETDLPIVLTGYQALLTADPAADPVDDTNNVFELTGTFPEDGKIAFPFSPAQTDRIDTIFFDVQLTDPAAVITTIGRGKFRFKQDITK